MFWMASVRKEAKGRASGVEVGVVNVWGAGREAWGAAGERDNGYKQKAEVKRHENKSPHFWRLTTVCSMPLSLSMYNFRSQ